MVQSGSARDRNKDRQATLADIFAGLKGGRHILVGITGGIGSGKSMAADLIRAAGYIVFSADNIARELMADNTDIRAEIAERLGEDIFDADGGIRRNILAARIFGDSPEHAATRRTLNGIVHPFVIEELAERIRRAYAEGAYCVFNESALLYETGLQDLYDYIITVDAPEELRLQRLRAARGMDETDIRQRMAGQLSPQFKKQAADFVIDNSGDTAALERAVTALMTFVPKLKPRSPQEREADMEE